jgi:multiple sugar transport system ATP-binding protein
MDRLELRNLTKRFDAKTVVSGVDLAVEGDELLFLLGPSGAGKTTILSMIAGIEDISEGEVLFDGQPMGRVPPHRRNVALTFENYVLYPNMTAHQNMAFPLQAPRVRGRYSREDIRKRVREVAELLQIDQLLDRFPDQLSGGERQRVSLGRMLVRDPEVFLLDEPIAHLDAQLRYRMRKELRRIQKEKGVMALYATPDQAEAVAMADRIALLDRGALQQVGRPEELYNRPVNTFVASLVGDPPMNFFDLTLGQDGGRPVLADTDFAIPAEGSALPGGLRQGRKYRVGVRPTDMAISRDQAGAHARATIYVTERVNRWDLVSLEVGKTLVQVRTSGLEGLNIGQEVGLSFDTGRLHFFDPETGRAVQG